MTDKPVPIVTNRVRCSTCGKSVSTEVPEHIIIRAYVECPECIEKQPDVPRRLREMMQAIKVAGGFRPEAGWGVAVTELDKFISELEAG